MDNQPDGYHMSRTIVVIGKGVGGGAGGNISGTIAATQVAYGSAANTIKGDAAYTFTEGTGVLKLGVTGSSANSVSITGSSAGALTLAAAGTNQNITATPTGSGGVLLGPSSLANQVFVGAVSDLTTRCLISFNNAFTNNTYAGVQSVSGNLKIQAIGNSIDFYVDGSAGLQVDSSRNFLITKKITSYNAVATAGWGAEIVQGYAEVTAQSTNGNIATYTAGAADGVFRVSADMSVTASTALATTLTVNYTDKSNTARVMVLPVQQLSGSFIAAGAITGTGAWETPTMQIRCKASTAITILSSAGTFTGVTFSASGTITQIG